MRHRRVLSLLSLALFALVVGCESSTDLEDVTSQGRWESMGALEAAFPQVRLELTEDASGNISGTWRRGSQVGSASGVNNQGVVSIELSSFEIGTVNFQGRFTNRYRLEGDLPGANLTGPAVFRRTRF
jgi:hypothetical protein